MGCSIEYRGKVFLTVLQASKTTTDALDPDLVVLPPFPMVRQQTGLALLGSAGGYTYYFYDSS